MADGSLAACTSYSGFNALVVEEGWEEIIKNQVYLHHSGTAASPIEYRRGLGPSSVLVCVYDICLPFIARPFFLPTALTRPLGVPTAEQARGRAPLMPFQHQQWAVSRKPPLWVWSVAWEHFVGYWFPATDDCVLKDVWHILVTCLISRGGQAGTNDHQWSTMPHEKVLCRKSATPKENWCSGQGC